MTRVEAVMAMAYTTHQSVDRDYIVSTRDELSGAFLRNPSPRKLMTPPNP